MAIEQKWAAVPPRLFTANGTSLGVITVEDTRGFKVKQHVVIKSNTQENKILQVKRVISRTQFIVGPLAVKAGQSLLSVRENISAYTVADSAFVFAEEQDKSKLKPDDIEQAVYEQEPTVAKRVIPVDQEGNFYDEDNPLPINNVGSAVNKDWDDLVLDRDPVTQDLVKATYKKAGVTVQVLDLTYDEFENLIEVKKS